MAKLKKLTKLKFHELCKQIHLQKLYGTFVEVENSCNSYDKSFKDDRLRELYAPVMKAWEAATEAFKPPQEKVDSDNDETGDAENAAVTLTRTDAKKTAAQNEVACYVKTYVLTGSPQADAQNLMEFHICKVTLANAQENAKNKAGQASVTH